MWSTGDYLLIERLNGRIILIQGNHDKEPNKFSRCKNIIAVLQEAEIMICKQRVRLSHYPYKVSGWKKYYYLIKDLFTRHKLKHSAKRPVFNGQWLLHGHTHSPEKLNKSMKSIHIGVDAWNFKPVNLNEIELILNQN
jgi:calcineurin-like phosphoesterase family protein